MRRRFGQFGAFISKISSLIQDLPLGMPQDQRRFDRAGMQRIKKHCRNLRQMEALRAPQGEDHETATP
jgi:hypothetical protein